MCVLCHTPGLLFNLNDVPSMVHVYTVHLHSLESISVQTTGVIELAYALGRQIYNIEYLLKCLGVFI